MGSGEEKRQDILEFYQSKQEKDEVYDMFKTKVGQEHFAPHQHDLIDTFYNLADTYGHFLDQEEPSKETQETLSWHLTQTQQYDENRFETETGEKLYNSLKRLEKTVLEDPEISEEFLNHQERMYNKNTQ